MDCVHKKIRKRKLEEYCCRLRDVATIKKYSDEEVLKKLRGEDLPAPLQVIFYSVGVTLYAAIERVEEWQDKKISMRMQNESRNSGKDKWSMRAATGSSEKRCFRCNKIGHVQADCYVKQKSKKLICYKCGKSGYIRYNCDNIKETNNTIMDRGSIIDERMGSL